jgi:predicted RNA-binding Zn-ribbon protein involved in translation (DUF1610 family)
MGIKNKRNDTKNRFLLARKKSRNPKKKFKKARESQSFLNRNQRTNLCWNCGKSMIIRTSKYGNVYFCESCKRYWKDGSEVFSGRKN